MEEVKRKSKIVCSYLGIILLMCVASFNIYNHFQKVRSIEKENKIVDEFIEEKKPVDIITGEETPVIEEKNNQEINYIMVIEIPKIGLKKGLCNKGQYCNTVSRNIQILEESDMPNVTNGNVLLAGHNGNSNVSFFNKLDHLNLGDVIYLYYDGIKYEYKLENYYDIQKTGEANIKRDTKRTTLVLITCKRNTKDKQVVYVAYLNNKYDY